MGDSARMKRLIVPGKEALAERQADHGGVGPILFQRLLHGGDLCSAIDFVDHMLVLPGSTIGKHHHGKWHELINDTEDNVEILVVQAAIQESGG